MSSASASAPLNATGLLMHPLGDPALIPPFGSACVQAYFPLGLGCADAIEAPQGVEGECDHQSGKMDSEQDDCMPLMERDIEESKYSRRRPQSTQMMPVKKVLVTGTSLASLKSAAGTPTVVI